MNSIQKTVLASFAAAAFPTLSGAVTIYNETGDAGNLPATAQATTDLSQSFDEIKGTLSPASGDGEDMYRIYIAGGGDFSAETVGGVSFDSELFLLDASGYGVYSNDDTTGYLTPSILPAHTALTPTAAGYYYLAITQCCSQPLSAGGAIFVGLDNTSSHLIVSGPTGPGGMAPISGYSSRFDQTVGGAYTIFLTGAQLAPTIPAVPEPATAGSMLGGLALAAAIALTRRGSAGANVAARAETDAVRTPPRG